jgi:hypothetical protein
MSEDVYDKLEKLLLAYKQNKELEMKKAEMTVKIANDILDRNRKHQMDLMQYFSQFINPSAFIKDPKD